MRGSSEPCPDQLLSRPPRPRRCGSTERSASASVHWYSGSGLRRAAFSSVATASACLLLGELDAAARQQRRGVVGNVLQRRVGHSRRLRPAGRAAARTPPVASRPRRRTHGSRGLAALTAACIICDRAVEVALEPSQVGRARVGLIERLEVDHLLIGHGRLRRRRPCSISASPSRPKSSTNSRSVTRRRAIASASPKRCIWCST